MPHSLFRAHLTRGPIVRAAADRVESDEAYVFVIEGPVGLAEQLLPLLAHVQIPVVLAWNEDLLRLYTFEDLDAVLEFFDRAELGDFAAENQEVGGRIRACTSFTARVIFSTERVLTDLG